MRRMSDGAYVFYGIQLSLYAGKVRSYLRKKRIPFVERSSAHPGFIEACAKVGNSKQPLIETPEGEVVQDTTQIIDFLEALHPDPPVYPDGACQRLVALLFELYGDEGLMKPAMHYRWDFPEHNDAFRAPEFGRGLSPGALGAVGVPNEASAAGPEGGVIALQEFMRGHAIPALGVTPQSAPAIEAAYEDLLDRLETHFRALPYLLGGRPSIGDFGMIAPLYAHLGRDPYPSSLMKRRAPTCYRWVERMNVADSGMAEFPDLPERFLPDDEIPETLLPILELMAQDYMPELQSIATQVDAWLVQHPEVRSGDRVPASTLGMGTLAPLGHHKIVLRGVEIELAVQHYSLWMLGRVQSHYDGLTDPDRERADAILEGVGLAPLITTRTARAIEREHYAEVFG